jgi:hypothetical protein
MMCIQLDNATRAELRSLRRTALPPVFRDRLETLMVSDASWSPLRIAAHLGRYPQTDRLQLPTRLHAPLPGGPFPFIKRPAPDAARCDRITGLLRDLLG